MKVTAVFSVNLLLQPSRSLPGMDSYFEEILKYDQQQLVNMAIGYEDHHGQSAEKFYWRFEPEFELSRLCKPSPGDLLTKEDWAKWFIEEQQSAAEDIRVGYYDDILAENIYEPIIIVSRLSGMFIWDGYHRVGGSCLANRCTIPAIVGLKLKFSWFELYKEPAKDGFLF